MADSSKLIACLMDVERHVSSSGWDQPARLFALVTTQTLLDVEPHLRGRVPEANPDALTAIEQDEFHATDDVVERLRGIFWPDTVEDLLGAEDLVPGLADALVDTFRSDEA